MSMKVRHQDKSLRQSALLQLRRLHAHHQQRLQVHLPLPLHRHQLRDQLSLQRRQPVLQLRHMPVNVHLAFLHLQVSTILHRLQVRELNLALCHHELQPRPVQRPGHLSRLRLHARMDWRCLRHPDRPVQLQALPQQRHLSRHQQQHRLRMHMPVWFLRAQLPDLCQHLHSRLLPQRRYLLSTRR